MSTEFNPNSMEDSRSFNSLPFQAGFACSTAFMMLIIQCFVSFQRSTKTTTWLSRLPILVSMTWFLTVLTWVATVFSNSNSITYTIWGTISNMLDAATKIQVIFYCTMRVLVSSNLKPTLLHAVYIINAIGIIISIFSGISITLPLYMTSMDAKVVSLMTSFYFVADIYISICDIITLYMYLYAKFNLNTKTLSSVYQKISDYGLISSFGTMALFTLFNIMYLALRLLYNFDPDLMISVIVGCVKYPVTCYLVTHVFYMTVGSHGVILSVDDTMTIDQRTINNRGHIADLVDKRTDLEAAVVSEKWNEATALDVNAEMDPFFVFKN